MSHGKHTHEHNPHTWNMNTSINMYTSMETRNITIRIIIAIHMSIALNTHMNINTIQRGPDTTIHTHRKRLRTNTSIRTMIQKIIAMGIEYKYVAKNTQIR